MRKKLLIASIPLSFIGGYLIGKHKKKSFYDKQIKDLQKENDDIWNKLEESIDENVKLFEKSDENWEENYRLSDENLELREKNLELDDENFELRQELDELRYEIGHLEDLNNRYETCLGQIIILTNYNIMDDSAASTILKIIKDNDVQYSVTRHSQDDKEG